MSIANLDYKHLFGVFSKNFVKGGVMIGITITIIEFIYKSNDLIGLYAFCTGSFIIAQILQYEHIATRNPKQIETFLFHSVTGGIAWVLYIFLLYYLYYNDFTTQHIVYISLINYLLVCALYYYLI
jgi:hypothetical protein